MVLEVWILQKKAALRVFMARTHGHLDMLRQGHDVASVFK